MSQSYAIQLTFGLALILWLLQICAVPAAFADDLRADGGAQVHSAKEPLTWYDVDNLIDQELDPGADPISTDDDVFFFDNTGSAVARGVEFEVECKLRWGLRGLASYSLAVTEDQDTGQRLNNSPQHLGKLGLSQSLWREKIFASLELQAMSRRETVAGNETDPFAVVNFTLYSRELVKGLEFSASLYNLFDQRYDHPISGDFYYTGPVSGNSIALDTVQQDGRQFRIKLTYRF